MNRQILSSWTLMVGMAFLALSAVCADEAPSVNEQIDGLTSMCADSKPAREARHAERTLYDRLGGYDSIHALTREIVQLHNENDAIKHMFTNVDSEALAKYVADFMASGTGGTESYSGRDMQTAHAGMKLTDADFMAAGGDIVKAMQSQGHGQNEIDEVLCILLSLKSQVVHQ